MRIFDKKWVDGKETRVLNEKQTVIAQQKQEAICEAFKDWIFKDPERREALCKKYNALFNNIRPREYDGSHIRFSGMTPEISRGPTRKTPWPISSMERTPCWPTVSARAKPLR